MESQEKDYGQVAYQEGYDTFMDGYRMGICPYMTLSPEWQIWRNGWIDGFQEMHGFLEGLDDDELNDYEIDYGTN